jgi:hypothetical protein
MREKSACAALKKTPDAHGGAAPALDHLPIARRSARANDHAAKTLLFEVPPITITAPNHEITFTIHSSIICNTLFRPYVVLTAPFRVKICFFAAFRIFISFRRFDCDFRFCRRNRSRFNSFSDNSVMAVSPQLTTF